VDRKFTKKEGKPFAVIWLEDRTGSLEVVLWNEVYVTVADALLPGKVIAIQGTLDKRDETVRATAQKVKILTAAAQSFYTYGQSHGTFHGTIHGVTHGVMHGVIHGVIHGTIHGVIHGTTHGTIHGNTHVATEGVSHGNNHGNVHGNVHGSIHGVSH
jgi:hypothetical protein